MIGHKLTISVTMDVSPFAWCLARAVLNILFTRLTKEQHTILIIKYCLTGCDIGSAFFEIVTKSVFKRMIQGALKFQGLKDLGHWPLSNCQTLTCAQFVGAIYKK